MYLHNFLIFVGCLVSYVQCQKICKKNQYTVVYSNDSSYCLNCDTCHEGRGLHPACGSRIPHPPKPDCKACLEGTFSDELDSAPCHSCQKCAEHEIVIAPCTSRSNSVCNGTCEAGFFYSKKDSTHSCQKCAYCCSDGKDEVISECVNQGSNASEKHCRPRPDKECSPGSSLPSPTDSLVGNEASESGSLSNATIVGIVFGVVIIIIIIVTLVICLLSRTRKKQGELGVTAAENYAQNGPKADPTVPYNQSDAPSSAVVPAEYHREPGSEAAAATTGNQADDKSEKLQYDAPCKMSSKSPLSRQNSLDSQNNRDGETGFRKRSNSAIRMEKLTRRLSEKDDSLLKEDMEGLEAQEINGNVCQNAASHSPTIGPALQPSAVPNPGFAPSNPGTPQVSPKLTPHHTDDESDTVSDHSNGPPKKVRQKSSDSHIGKGSIQIVQQPKSQNKTEGSRVEFSCVCQRQGNCEIRYQWRKDETDLQQQNYASLVLDSVRMQDFGCYKCCIHVTHKGGHRESVSSEGAFLEVTPCEGMRLKNLNEVDNLETRDEIASLLEARTPGLGDYRQIAEEYGMKKHEVKGLKNSGQPGQEVMEFLHGSKPDLTVYSFCKMLKGDNMKRFDIVKILEDHLSIQIEHR